MRVHASLDQRWFRTRETSRAIPPVLHAETAHRFICDTTETPVLPPEAFLHATNNHHPDSSLESSISGMATMSGDAATAAGVSMSAPEIHSERSLSASPIAASPSYNPTSSSSSLNTKLEASPGAPHAMDPNATTSASLDVEPDAQILEALRSKDRIYVLKLGEQMEALIKERRCVSGGIRIWHLPQFCILPGVTRRTMGDPRGSIASWVDRSGSFLTR